MNKTEIRTTLLEKRMELSQKDVERASLLICDYIFNLLRTLGITKSVGLYAAYRGEVNLFFLEKKLNSQGIKTFYPKMFKNPDRISFFEASINSMEEKSSDLPILEPVEVDESLSKIPEAIIVPAIGFDKLGYRIGYGKGYYDRFLQGYNGVKIGSGFDFQIVETIPTEEHDEKLDFLVIESGVLGFSDQN